jgi:hypothetical protein
MSSMDEERGMFIEGDKKPMWIPGWVKKDIILNMNVATNKAFTKKEIESITDKITSTIPWSVLMKFKHTQVMYEGKGWNTPVEVLMTESQKRLFESHLPGFLNKYKNDPLMRKINEEYRKALQSKRLRIIPDE